MQIKTVSEKQMDALWNADKDAILFFINMTDESTVIVEKELTPEKQYKGRLIHVINDHGEVMIIKNNV